MQPTFSVIIPTYNRAWILPRTIQGILDQEYTDWELIIVDDGSTDNTRELVEEFAAADDRIQYVYQENARQSAARQNGLKHAQGEWVVYVDSDEEIYSYFLSSAKEFFNAHSQVNYAFAWNDRTLELHDVDHTVLQQIPQPATELPLKQITLENFAKWEIKPCGTGIFHKRDIVVESWKTANPIKWDTNMHIFEDIDMLFQIGIQYPDTFGFIDRALFHQRQVFGKETEGVCANTTYTEWADAFEVLYKKYADTWLMQNQQWYPKKVEQYRERQRLFDAGKYPSNIDRIFGRSTD